MKKITLLGTLALVLFVVACTTHKVERVAVDEKIDLSGRWNDTDSRMVADEMVQQILHGTWVENHMKSDQGDRPVVVVGLVYNKTSEHIEAATFVKDVERAFINSGKVRLVQAGEKREELRRERAGQQEFASLQTAKQWGKELGADFMLNGDIASIIDTYKREQVTYYQVSMELSNLETNEVVWIGDKKIKKYIVK